MNKPIIGVEMVDSPDHEMMPAFKALKADLINLLGHHANTHPAIAVAALSQGIGMFVGTWIKPEAAKTIATDQTFEMSIRQNIEIGLKAVEQAREEHKARAH